MPRLSSSPPPPLRRLIPAVVGPEQRPSSPVLGLCRPAPALAVQAGRSLTGGGSAVSFTGASASLSHVSHLPASLTATLTQHSAYNEACQTDSHLSIS